MCCVWSLCCLLACPVMLRCICIYQQDGWSPWSPQASYDRRRHRNCFPTRKSASISEKVNISWGHRSVDVLFTCVDLHVLLVMSRSINMLSVTDFVRKWIISGVRVQAGLHLDMLDADRSPKYAVSVHAGTSQVDFEVDCPPPACLSTRRSFDHHGKGNGNFV